MQYVQKVNEELALLSSTNATMPDIPRFRHVDDASSGDNKNIELVMNGGFETDIFDC